jgi:hypothetical protein
MSFLLVAEAGATSKVVSVAEARKKGLTEAQILDL